uniref:Uncharacterized protein n=1 Tax=viral metagenome TaxID=1070528 RepID=A0A6C0DD90_9ZZZZ
MQTMMFIERPEDQGRMVIGYQLQRENYLRSPAGIIRIARYPGLFWIEKNMGYYGDIYMKQFIRKWKQKTYENKQRRADRLNCALIMNRLGVVDVDNIVLEFL